MNNEQLKILFEKIRNKDKEAFTTVYNEMKTPVFTVIYRIVNNKEIVEDITQEVFVRLFVSTPDPSVKNIRAWIFTLARNLAIDSMRKTQATNIDDIDIISDNEENFLLKLSLDDAMQKLSLIERETVVLHLNAGLKFKEIASILSLSLPATYRTYKRALKKLRTLLSGGAL